MKELLQRVLPRKPEQPQGHPVKQKVEAYQSLSIRTIDPVSEPDAARLRAFLIKGVVNE